MSAGVRLTYAPPAYSISGNKRLVCSNCHRPFIARPSLSSKPLRQQHLQIRATSSSTTALNARSASTRFKNLFLGSAISIALLLGYALGTDTRSSFQKLPPPILRLLYPDAEESHHAGNYILRALYKFGLHPRERGNDGGGDLAILALDNVLNNPIGISAGLDKNGELPDALFALGPSIVEIGGVTPKLQDGNEKPRVFRLPSQNALINRYGLNSLGADGVSILLRKRVRKYAYEIGYGIDSEAERAILDGETGVMPGSLAEGKMLAVQIAKNKDTSGDDIAAVVQDYTYCVEKLGRYADILVVNVSSPNTPHLRKLQQTQPLTDILSTVVDAAKRVDRRTKPAVMVKVSPDESSDGDIRGICSAVIRSGVDGVVVANTTNSRPVEPSSLTLKEASTLKETGGFSGPGTFEHTRSLVERYRRFLDAMTSPGSKYKVIFASGGITSGPQALQVLEAGASVGMVYTAMVYGGAGTCTRLKRELREEMRRQIAIAASEGNEA